MKLNVLIIGAGMYVCGRGTDEFGTILPALCEYQRQGKTLGTIVLASTSFSSNEIVQEKVRALNQLMGTNLSLSYFPEAPYRSNSESYKAALATIPRPAVAILVVPDHLHFKIASDCLNAGLHTLVVKPLTPTVKESKELINIQKEKKVYGAVEFHKRFDRANLKLKEVISQGRLGDPLYFIVEYSQRKGVPAEIFAAWIERTNIFQYLGVHYVDIIYFVTGAKPSRIMAMGQYGWLRANGMDAFDAVHATIEWESKNGKKFLSYILTNWIDPESTSAMSYQKLKVIGTKGRYDSDQKCRGITIVTDDAGIKEINPDFCCTYPAGSGAVSYRGYGIESIHSFIEDVIDLHAGNITVKELELSRPTFSEALPSTAVVDAVNRGLAEPGSWVEIKY